MGCMRCENRMLPRDQERWKRNGAYFMKPRRMIYGEDNTGHTADVARSLVGLYRPTDYPGSQGPVTSFVPEMINACMLFKVSADSSIKVWVLTLEGVFKAVNNKHFLKNHF